MKQGFTLIEVMIVVALLGILSSIALPMYSGYVDGAKQTVAQDGLRAIYLKQQEYFADNNQYYSTVGALPCVDATAAINTNLFAGKQVLDNTDYDFCIISSAANNFIARAENSDDTITPTVDENNVASF